MSILKPIFTLLLLVVAGLKAQAEDIKIGTKHSLKSEILSEERRYLVSLPPSYAFNDYRKYPVLYLLDADFNYFYQTFTGMLQQMASDASPKIPEMIVVGIVSQQRVRDSSPTQSLVQYGGKPNAALAITGGADKFISFINQELIPHINQNYRTSDYKILAGYSFTGLPVLHSLFTNPAEFNAYLAIDPSMWWDDHVMLKRAKSFLKGQPLNKRQLFIATSQRVGKAYPKENYVIDFIKLLADTPKQGLQVHTQIYGREENHHSMPVPAFYTGLSALFDGFMPDEETRFRPAAAVQRHYKQLSEKLGTQLMLSEGLINYFAADRLYNDQFKTDAQTALGYFKLNTTYYPKSFNAWNNLAKAYKHMGDKKNALKAFKIAAERAPDNQAVRDEIEALKAALVE